jgi:histidinol phosphatase-like PHP family hydrolase
MFAFGSDAHRPEDVGNFARAEALAKSAKVEPREVLNVRDTPAATGEKQRFWHRLGLTGWPGEA